MKRGDNVNISTLAYLCKILECSIEDVVSIKY
ncbi:helix-turn-helix domain-containing protein [Eubacterium ventriosum]|nr:helix-turn-helix domain-containing protein [Eubacterium ventriosum]MBT9693414.1 helix-turn-helix domain-containing protein [Eubacterium ventriosum]